MQNAEVIHPESLEAWRHWLQEHHQTHQSVWVVFNKKQAEGYSISWSNAVDQALCFGWIDGRRQPIDEDTFRQYFCKRKPKSTWSKINKEKIERLIKAGLMQEAGLAIIEVAKQNGSWTLLDEVEELIVPADLGKALDKIPNGRALFENLSRSKRRELLAKLVLAKTAPTRQKRIAEIMDVCR